MCWVMTSASDMETKIGRITVPHVVDVNIVSVKITDSNSIVKDLFCSILPTCIIHIIARYGASAIITGTIFETHLQIEGLGLNFLRNVDQIRYSDDKATNMMNLLPKVYNTLVKKSDYEPIIDISYNGSHYIFSATYPNFTNLIDEDRKSVV